MKTPDEIINWCDMLLKQHHPNTEDINFFNAIKSYMETIKYVNDIIPIWSRYKQTDSITELHETSMELFAKYAYLMEKLSHD